MQADAPDGGKLPQQDIVGVTVLLLTCLYQDVVRSPLLLLLLTIICCDILMPRLVGSGSRASCTPLTHASITAWAGPDVTCRANLLRHDALAESDCLGTASVLIRGRLSHWSQPWHCKQCRPQGQPAMSSQAVASYTSTSVFICPASHHRALEHRLVGLPGQTVH